MLKADYEINERMRLKSQRGIHHVTRLFIKLTEVISYYLLLGQTTAIC